MITGISSLWRVAFARKKHNVTLLQCTFFVSDKCIKFLTVNKMHCKYVILLIIYIQETITLQRHSCSVRHIKRPKTYISEWLDSRKHKYAILLLLSSYLRSLERWRERKRHRKRERGYLNSLEKYTSCFISLLPPNSIILLVSAHLQ